MFRNTRGASTKTVLMGVAVVLAVAVVIFWVVRANQGGPELMRTWHCKACDKDFQVDMNKLGSKKPTCLFCSGSDVIMVTEDKQK